MKSLILIGALGILAGCASSGNSIPVVNESIPPHLWSDHKQLDIPVAACALKGYSALKSLGFSAVIQNGNYSYGNFHSNRAAVKCVADNDGSFVYIAVAGAEKEIVEKLRNELVWKM